jgi:hypothetical protein
MAKKSTGDMFGAEVETIRDKKVGMMVDGFKGVDADVPKTREVIDDDGNPNLIREMVRMPAPRNDKMHVVTSGGKNISDKLVRLKANYKLMRSAFQFSPLDDKALWEERMQIAYHEMQAQAFREKLENYKTRHGDKARPEQVALYQSKVDEHHGAWLRLVGQGN